MRKISLMASSSLHHKQLLLVNLSCSKIIWLKMLITFSVIKLKDYQMLRIVNQSIQKELHTRKMLNSFLVCQALIIWDNSQMPLFKINKLMRIKLKNKSLMKHLRKIRKLSLMLIPQILSKKSQRKKKLINLKNISRNLRKAIKKQELTVVLVHS